MEQSPRKQTVLFCCIQFFFWASYTIYYLFIVTFLTDAGYSKSLCGVITMLMSLISVFWQPILGYLSDTFLTAKKLLFFAFTLAIVLVLLLPQILPVVWLGIITLLVISMLDNSYYTYIIDTWVLKRQQEEPAISFSATKMSGSAGGALIALFCGGLIDQYGSQVIYWANAIALAICLIFVAFQKAVPCTNRRARTKEEKDDHIDFLPALKLLIKNREYVIFVSAMALLQFGLRLTVTYYPVFIAAAGGGAKEVGFGCSALFIGEFFMVAITSYLVRKGVAMTSLYQFALTVGALRIAAFLFAKNLWLLILLQGAQALTTGLHARLCNEYISKMVPKQILATASTFCMGLSLGAGGTFGNLAGGFILDSMGNDAYAIVSAVVIAAGALLFLPNYLKGRKKTVTQQTTN